MTLKPGIDTVGAKDIIVEALYQLKDDSNNPLFAEGRILTGDAGKISLYNGVLGLFGIGDTLEIEEGLRGQPRWGSHAAQLLIVTSGETSKVKDSIDEIRRIIEIEIKKDPTFSTDGLHIMIPDKNPVKRLRVSFDKPKQNVEPSWNSSILMFFTVKIADLPES